MSYSIEAITEDCYEGTTCLINKFNITDEKKLANVESAITRMGVFFVAFFVEA